MEKFILPEKTHVGYVQINVSDINKLTDFYTRIIGFKQAGNENNTICLSSSGNKPYHIKLTEIKDAAKPARNATGLFHIAIKVPAKKELAQTLAKLGRHNIRFHGFSDHGVSEAMYLADPDGNGIEIYYDKPPELWTYKDNEVQMFTEPLDINSLINEIGKQDMDTISFSPGTCIGHIHLKVSDLEKAKYFYHDLLGFDITQSSYQGALFVSAGGYHHHIGLNIWYSHNGPNPHGDTLGLRSFNIVLPNIETAELIKERAFSKGIKVEDRLSDNFSTFMIHDPDQNKIEFSHNENPGNFIS